ncbi:MAG: PEP-CTERM sorting domain-containing protein [Verrucomicrobia bacterium]|nr:PEP-CTERM sorting domain-containing protein [Verrucomicrobiota bacterium]
MKRSLVTLVAALATVVSSHALISVNWQDNSGFVMPDNVTPIMDPSTGGTNILTQLIFTPSGIIGAATVGGGVSGDNVILDQQVFNEGFTANPYGATLSENYQGPDLVGKLFVRVFQGGTDIGVAPVLTWYYDGLLYDTVVNAGGAQPPDIVEATSPASSGSGPFGTYVLNQQIVPEPTTLALAALGVLGVVARRFSRS